MADAKLIYSYYYTFNEFFILILDNIIYIWIYKSINKNIRCIQFFFSFVISCKYLSLVYIYIFITLLLLSYTVKSKNKIKMLCKMII